MPNEFEEKLHDILANFQIEIKGSNTLPCIVHPHKEAYQKIISLIKESLPKKHTGAKVHDFLGGWTEAIEEMENKLGVEG